jgi:cell division protein FtsZ
VAALIDPNLSLLDTFKTTTQILLDGARGVWRLLTHRGLIPLHFADLCAVLRERHAESWFAAVEAAGPERANAVVEKLFAHPVMDGGAVLAQSEAALVSLMGGPDLSLADMNRVMEQIKQRNPRAQLMLGAVVDEQFRDRLALTVIATRGAAQTAAAEAELPRPAATRKPASRNSSSTPALIPDSADPARPASAKNPRSRKAADRLRQTQLPLDIVNKSRFDKTEATILNGEDLDVPTFIRRGVALN